MFLITVQNYDYDEKNIDPILYDNNSRIDNEPDVGITVIDNNNKYGVIMVEVEWRDRHYLIWIWKLSIMIITHAYRRIMITNIITAEQIAVLIFQQEIEGIKRTSLFHGTNQSFSFTEQKFFLNSRNTSCLFVIK